MHDWHIEFVQIASLMAKHEKVCLAHALNASRIHTQLSSLHFWSCFLTSAEMAANPTGIPASIIWVETIGETTIHDRMMAKGVKHDMGT